MNCKIETTPDFARELKQLAKRYPSMKDDYSNFIDALRKSPLMGKPLGKHLRKVRFPIGHMRDFLCVFSQRKGHPFIFSLSS